MPVTIQSTSFRYKNSNGTFESAACIKGEGVPLGGTIGQVLRKVSNDNYDTEWSDMEVATLEETAEIINNYGKSEEGDDDSMLVTADFYVSDGSNFIPNGFPYYKTNMDASDIAAAYTSGKSVIFKLVATDETAEYNINYDIYMQLVGFEIGDGCDLTFEEINGGDYILPRFSFVDVILGHEEAIGVANIGKHFVVENKIYFIVNNENISDDTPVT